MAAPSRVGRPAHAIRIVKYVITVGAVVITSLGSMALNDERALAGTSEPISMGIPEQVVDGARDALAPLVGWLAEPGEGPACSPEASPRP